MKGLIKNNFYSVGSALTWSVALCILINIVVLIGAVRYPNIIEAVPMIMLGQIGAFVGLVGTALQKDNTSKWTKFERTLPIKISHIVQARYLTFLIFAAVGMVLATITVLSLPLVARQPLNLERVGFGYSFGLVFALITPSLLYPLILKFGPDKSEILLMVALVFSIVLFTGSAALAAPFLKNYSNGNLIYRVGMIAFSLVAFIVSYFFSLAIYKKKEL